MKRLHSLSIKDLRSLLIIDATCSLGRAALQLGTSVAALSRRLTRIEDVLGVTLFERSISGTLATGPGRLVLQHARRMITEAQHLLAFGIGAAESLKGEIRLGLACPLLHPTVETWLHFWNKSFPRMRIGLYAPQGENITTLLTNRAVDAAILHPDVLLSTSPAYAP